MRQLQLVQLQLVQLSECQWATSAVIFIASGEIMSYKILSCWLIHNCVLSLCQLMTSSHTVIVHQLLMFWSKSWCDLITPVLLLWYSDLNQVSISNAVLSLLVHAALPLSAVDVCCWSIKDVYISWYFRQSCSSLTTCHAAVGLYQ